MSWSGNLCSFPFGLCRVLGWALEEGGERAHVLRAYCVYYHPTMLRSGEGLAQAEGPGWNPQWSLLGAIALGMALGEFANREVFVPWLARCPFWLTSSLGC